MRDMDEICSVLKPRNRRWGKDALLVFKTWRDSEDAGEFPALEQGTVEEERHAPCRSIFIVCDEAEFESLDRHGFGDNMEPRICCNQRAIPSGAVRDFFDV